MLHSQRTQHRPLDLSAKSGKSTAPRELKNHLLIIKAAPEASPQKVLSY